MSDGLDDVAAAVVVDATGDAEAIGPALRAARDGGTVVLLGSPRGVSPDVPLRDLQERRLRLVGAHVSALATQAKREGGDPFGALARAFLEGVASGRVPAHDLSGEATDPREVGLMYARLAARELDRVHLDWTMLPPAQRLSGRRLLRWPALPETTCAVLPASPAPARTGAGVLRFAVLGCGDVGDAHARAVARARNAELVLLADAVPGLAEQVASRHGGTAVPQVEQALDPDRVDAVILAVPHDLHAPLVTQAARAGLHVVVEKPLGVDLRAARRAALAAERTGVLLSVCFPYRYGAGPAAARALAVAGALGPLRGAAVVFHADKPASYWVGGFSGRATSPWRAQRDRAGGGVMIMNLTHHVDLLLHLTGAVVEQVAAVARTAPGQEVEEAIAATLTFTGGAVATVIGSSSTRGAPPSRLEIWGELGTLQLEPEARLWTERALPGVVPGRWNALPEDGQDDVRTAYVEHFAAAVLDGRPPDVSAQQALAVQAVVDAAYRSVASGRPEAVEPA